MKLKEPEKLKLWVEAERALTVPLSPEFMPEVLRTSGLISIQGQSWASALLRLEEAIHLGINDLQTLDAFGEAAYQTNTPQALLPYQNLYRDPLVAVHMARAFMKLGNREAAREYLRLANETLLKAGIEAVLGVAKDIESAAEAMFAPTLRPDIADLNLIEYWQALAPIAEVMKRQDLVDLAEVRFKSLAYGNPVGHYNQALRLLADGEFRAGWKLHEWRLVPGSQCAAVTAFADIPMWEGEGLSGSHLLVVMENGFGDQIFAMRYLRALSSERLEHLSIAAAPEMLQLLKDNFPEASVYLISEAQAPAFWQGRKRPEAWVYSLSIPARAGHWSPIFSNGYLTAEHLQQTKYRELLEAKNPRNLPVHGLVWHGDVRTAPMRTRAYSLEEFLQASSILDSPKALVCLQKDVTPEELRTLQSKAQQAGCIVIDASSALTDFSVTAAWISVLERMWTCDTATAHLAGALAVPTTVLIRNKSIWYWRNEPGSEQCVWYRSCRIEEALAPKVSFMFDLPN